MIRNDEERFDNDMVLMTGELAKMLADLVEALGGEAVDSTPAARATAPAASLHDQVKVKMVDAGLDVVDYDPAAETLTHDRAMYDQAVTIVLAQRRASISLVQRHLRIGYNRAARLLEAMEQQGVVSAMQSNGNRDILKAGGEARGTAPTS